MNFGAARRPFALGLAALAVLLISTLAPGQAGAGIFQEGVVEVNGYGWTTDPVPVQLNDIAPTDDGQTTYTVRDILESADGSSSQFNVDTVPAIAVTLPGSVKSVSCSGDQMRAESSACPIFRATADHTEMSYEKGSQTKTYTYENYNPEIFISQAKGLTVKLTTSSSRVKSGGSASFKATTTGANGKVTYDWDFGDGSTARNSSGTISHKFTGNDKEFLVVVSASSPGQRGDDAVVKITVGKVTEAKPKPKKVEKEEESTDDLTTDYPDYGGYYDYGSGTGGGTGAGTSSGSSAATPASDPRPEPEQPVTEPSGETVTGQVIDPTQIAAVVPSDTPSASGGEEASSGKGESGGGGIPGGVKTALGIGALLGLGGLAEAGAFSGAFRRFRFRL